MDSVELTPQVTLETLPKHFANLANEVSLIKALLVAQATPPPPMQAVWMNMAELCNYIPDHPAKQTVYGWVSNGTIPNHKGGKKLRFLKSEIDLWLNGKKRLTSGEADVLINNFLTSKAK
jgi:excisionase family DNA binding protein